MDIYKLIHILSRRIPYLVIIPLIAGTLMFLLTIHQKKEFSASASIFTGITSKSSLDDQEDTKVDFFATKADYNNMLSILGSRSVIEETSLRLLASHLILDKPVANIISKKSFEELHKRLPREILSLIVKNDAEATYLNLKNYLRQDKHNFLYGLLNYDHPQYSCKAIEKIKSVQEGGSDIVNISYMSEDPAIAFQTLNIYIQVFLSKYSELKKSQTSAVVEYFEKQLQKSSAMLDDAEERLLVFNKENSIINYNEQTKQITVQNEEIQLKEDDILMDFKASDAVLQKLEEETKSRFSINLKTKDIMDIRTSLISVNQKLAALEIMEGDTTSSSVRKLSATKKNLETRLRSKVDSLYIYKRNSDGIAVETLLDDWLKTIIDYESSQARLMAIQEKNKEFQKIYAHYAPLGSNLKRFEREIDVKERAYLEILHHLGLAKLKQQNEELMSNMRILDPPQLPIDAEPTKRKLFVVLIALFAFIFTALGFIIFELLDRTVKTVKRFETYSGIPVPGALIRQSSHEGEEQRMMNTRSLKPIIENIIKQRMESGSPVIIQVFSNWRNEGKTFFMQVMRRKLTELGYKVQAFRFDEKRSDGVITRKDTFAQSSYAGLINGITEPGTDIVLLLIPALSETIFNARLFPTANMSYFLANAGRTWSQADNRLLGQIKSLDLTIEGVLNNVHPEDMEEILGEIHRKRSKFRIFIKRIFKRFIA